MKRLIGIALFTLVSTAGMAEDASIDPVAAVKQLYLMTPRQSKTDSFLVRIRK